MMCPCPLSTFTLTDWQFLSTKGTVLVPEVVATSSYTSAYSSDKAVETQTGKRPSQQSTKEALSHIESKQVALGQGSPRCPATQAETEKAERKLPVSARVEAV